MKVNEADVLDGMGLPTDPNTVYELHAGANLISFPFEGSIDISLGIPDEIEPLFDGIIGEGLAATQLTPFNWVGSLASWEGTKGYWAKVNEDLSFSFNSPAFSRFNIVVDRIDRHPDGFEYHQSSEQAFYFIESLNISNYPELENTEQIQDGVWLLAYCGDILVGAREWNGSYTDIPVMGNDNSLETAGYCQDGEIPVIKIYIDDSGEIINMNGDIPAWSSNELYTVNILYICCINI